MPLPFVGPQDDQLRQEILAKILREGKQAAPEFAKGTGAGLAGMPVDLVAEILRFGGKGVPVGEKPVMGSQWLREQMGVPEDSMAATVGEFASPDPFDAVRASMHADDLLQAMFLGSKGVERLKKEGVDVDALPTSVDASGNKRWEISDEEMDLTEYMPKEDKAGQFTASMADALRHPRLFQAYPELGESTLRIRSDTPTGGYFQPDNKEIGVDSVAGAWELEHLMTKNPRGNGLKGLATQRTLDTLAHENQHWVDDFEGYESGTNANSLFLEPTPEFKEGIDKWNEIMIRAGYPSDDLVTIPGLVGYKDGWDMSNDLDNQGSWLMDNAGLKESEVEALQYDAFGGKRPAELVKQPYDQYLTNEGEVRARNTAKRRKMDIKERRRTNPEITEDRPRNVQWSSKKDDK
jgi:hypothetical protein